MANNNENTVTPIGALNACGGFRLAARIADLKKQGMEIKTRLMHDDESGKKWAEYFI